MIATPQGTVEYQESGTGTPVVFVPGSFSTGASWRGIATPLSERYRTITTSLLGYGKTQERRAPGRDWLSDEMDVLDAVLTNAGAPAHLVAHSFGAWVALATVMWRRPRLLSLTLLEPTVFNLLTQLGESGLREQVHAMTSGYVAAWRAGDAQAVRHVIDFYGGAETFDAYPAAVKEKVIAQTPVNILDWKTGDAMHPSPEDFRSVQIPTLVIHGSDSHPAMQRCNQLLASRLPTARSITLAHANHFMITTHATMLSTAIEEHIQGAALA